MVAVYGVPTVPFGSVPLLMERPAGLMVTVMVPDPFCGGLPLSVTETIPVLVPGPVGVPVTVQSALRVRPAGRLPDVSLQVYGPVPPKTGTLPVYVDPVVPDGSVPPTDSVPEVIVMLSGPVTELAGFAESVACTETVLVPATVGVPVTAQFAARVKPVGSVPEASEQLYGPVPPDTPTAALYGVLTAPLGSVPVVRVSVPPPLPPLPPVMAMLKDAVAVVPLESATCAVKVYVPATVGVPDSMPVAPLSDSPLGSAPDLTVKVYGAVPPLAARVVEYAVPTTPAGGLPLSATAVAIAVIVICREAVTVYGTSLESTPCTANE